MIFTSPASNLEAFDAGTSDFPSLTPSLCPLSPQGFGSVTAEHWLGNEYVYQLTSQRQYALRVELTDWEGHQAFSLYDRFQIGSEKQNYR